MALCETWESAKGAGPVGVGTMALVPRYVGLCCVFGGRGCGWEREGRDGGELGLMGGEGGGGEGRGLRAADDL